MASAMLMLLRASQSAPQITVRRFIEMTQWPVRSVEIRMTDGVSHHSRVWPVDKRNLERLTGEVCDYFASRADQSAILVLRD